ncbi:MAG: trypsin-like peptidase domain-containing protein [Desulfobacterales bacterium]|nr:MAG: trypsin-like peptidase domain-containing protein [Desulfobacterales bacterium]
MEIYNQNKQLIGTGTSISFSGLILTAKHVLEDHGESGSRSPNYFLKVMIRRYQRADYEKAELLAVHPYMDLAILVNRFGQPIPPVPIGGLKGLKPNDTVMIIGHRKGQSDGELYKVITATIDEIDRHGHIILGRGVDRGTSGGPAIYRDRLIGVVRNSTIDRTTVVPVQSAWDYLKLMGVELTKEGLAIKTNHIAELASKAGKYEEILMDIQMDVNWFAEMSPIRDKNDDPTLFPKDVALKVWYQKKLSTQPSFNTLVSLDVTPVFSGQAFASRLSEERKTFLHSGWLLAAKGMLEFANLGMDIEVAADQHYSQFGIERKDFVGFDIVGQIDSIQGQGFVRIPEKHHVCFSLRINDDSKLFPHSVRVNGFRCPEDEPAMR